ncbi:hypothetical protein [Mariniflexile sp. AS56]|uniref:hypothetical protein n=1 Tax=Mariniflexile sp. AS56 TaxID=3063957 RepID=UPI0026EC642E|nr:hypothetical protein [Mariniflexile sp. AS56]MDO7173141.1 hypothetical protein [Mariniflexile sp. AS56]
MRIFLKLFFSISVVFILTNSGFAQQKIDVKSELYSIDTKYTITKVRTGKTKKETILIASSYEGTVLGVSFDGKILWKNPLSGFMNHDIWCQDITGDGIDEILIANADGNLYCLNTEGNLVWTFKTGHKNPPPMYAVTALNDGKNMYVVCGGFDKSFYYLTPKGVLIKAIKSSTYSDLKPWGKNAPKTKEHTINFLKTLKQPDGSEVLVVHGSHNHMQSKGSFYFFKPLADLPFKSRALSKKDVLSDVGDMTIVDIDGDGTQEILLGTSAHTKDTGFSIYNPETDKSTVFSTSKKPINLGFGYRVAQPTTIKDGNSFKFLTLIGNNILLSTPGLDAKTTEILDGKYSYNDMWKDPATNKIILASSQSGGSCIHVMDTDNPKWKKAYENLAPPGKISTILSNSSKVRERLKSFKKPSWERAPLPVYLMSENLSTALSKSVAKNISEHYKSPLFLNTPRGDKENWDRSTMSNKVYSEKRDQRMKYVLSQEQVLENIIPKFENAPGIAYWAGHGNDPYMYSLGTTKKVIDAAKGKKTVLIYPEMGDHSKDFEYVLNDLIFPLAKYAQGKNTNIFLRSKNIFWQGDIYHPMWSRLVSGEFADVFVPSMEETTDKTMDLSIAGRMGLWASGSVNSWGTRGARDNTSFDRSRQHSHQMLPNHFLRTMVYHVSSGAQYLDNFPVDQDYMSLLWELIAKGALYVPQREEIVSFSPVHLSMKEPDHHYMEDGTNVKWTTFYDSDFEDNNAFVFSRMNGSWMGAPVTDWDFSKYAAGVKERRLSFLPSYSNGMVLITPPQKGVYADKSAARGFIQNHMHPLYKDILKEYITDGRNYISEDGKETFKANEFYKTVENNIKESSKLLPLTVSGDVAWVVAQTSPNHLRLTIVDNGYINPDDRKAIVTFHTVIPLKMTDILEQSNFNVSDKSSVEVEIPCGLFRFIDIELKDKL